VPDLDTRPLGRVSRWRWRDHLPGVVILVLGLCASVIAAAWTHARQLEQDQRVLARRAGDVSTSLKNSLDLWREVLIGVGALFDASDEVTERDFTTFAGPALARHRGLSALEWFPVITGAQRPLFEATTRAQGLPDFAVRWPGKRGTLEPAPHRDDHLVLRYAEPRSASVPFGLDLYFDPGRRATVEQARDAASVTVSPRIHLVEDPPHVYSVAMYLPVYARGHDTRTQAGRRGGFLGVVVALVRLDQLAERAFHGIDLGDLHVTLRDTQATPAESVLLERGAAPEGDATSWSVPVDFAGRRWLLAFQAPVPDGLASWGPVLGGGIAVSLLLAVILSTIRVTRRLRRAANLSPRVGQYTLEEKLGEGGMGLVFRARHAMLRRPTALKVLKADQHTEAQLARFEREVQLTASLTHPNTIVVFDYGRTPDGTFYYAMELVEGIDFDELVEQHGAQPPGRVIHLLQQVAGSLAEAHAIGLIHRDIKPANLMLCRRGGVPDVVKVLDFGLVADIALDAAASDSLTGTPTFMPPEALTGGAMDARSDLYSLGLVGYYLLTGQRPVLGESLAEVIHQQLSITPPLPSARLGQPLSSHFEALLMSCLAKDPADRPTSAAALRDALLAITDVPRWDMAAAEAFWQRQPRVRRRRAGTPPPARFDVSLADRR
jgi:CHASE1-domain containing sensor protein